MAKIVKAFEAKISKTIEVQPEIVDTTNLSTKTRIDLDRNKIIRNYSFNDVFQHGVPEYFRIKTFDEALICAKKSFF